MFYVHTFCIYAWKTPNDVCLQLNIYMLPYVNDVLQHHSETLFYFKFTCIYVCSSLQYCWVSWHCLVNLFELAVIWGDRQTATFPSLNFPPLGRSCALLWPINVYPALGFTPRGPLIAKRSVHLFTQCMAAEQSTDIHFVSPTLPSLLKVV